MTISLWGGAIAVVAFNVVAYFLEIGLLSRIYRLVPELAHKEKRDEPETESKSKSAVEQLEVAEKDIKKEIESKKGCLAKMTKSYRTLIRGWKTYRKQKAFRAGLGMSLLYMTVLAFGGIFNGYLVTQGMKFWEISLFQGAAAAMALLGTFVYPRLRRRVGVTRTGLLALAFQFSCLLVCAASIFLPGNSLAEVNNYDSQCGGTNEATCTKNSTNSTNFNYTTPSTFPTLTSLNFSSTLSTTSFNFSSTTSYNYSTVAPTMNSSDLCVNKTTPDRGNPYSPSMIALLVGLVPSRFGLWMFDLALMQIYQETVSANDRGIVGGVQWVLNYNFDMLRFVLVTGLSKPSQFPYLMLISVALVGLGFALYSTYAKSVRGHLFHCSISCFFVNPDKREEEKTVWL